MLNRTHDAFPKSVWKTGRVVVAIIIASILAIATFRPVDMTMGRAAVSAISFILKRSAATPVPATLSSSTGRPMKKAVACGYQVPGITLRWLRTYVKTLVLAAHLLLPTVDFLPLFNDRSWHHIQVIR